MLKKNKIIEIIKEEIVKQQEEEKHKSKEEELKNVTIQIFFDKKVGTTDIMIQIRTLLGVNTTYSVMKTKLSKLGRKVLTLRISYDTMTIGNTNYLEVLFKHIKKISGVKIVKVLGYGSKSLTQQIDNPSIPSTITNPPKTNI